MSIKISLKRGLDINIIGEANKEFLTNVKTTSCAIYPDDYPGFTPKPDVKEGDTVFAGSVILHDKNHENIKIVSPASGTIKAIIRGERRKIERIEIDVDTNTGVFKHELAGTDTRDGIKQLLLQSGLWVMMRQRPYDIVPNPDKTPRDIFVTGFDSAPLAPDFNRLIKGKNDEIIIGLNALSKLTDGKVYIGLREEAPNFDNNNIVTAIIKGPHPAGNAGIQAANIAPVNKGESIWTIDLVTVARIGALISTGIAPMDTTIAITGSEVKCPQYISTTIGAAIPQLLDGQIDLQKNNRIISGNVLTGTKVTFEGHLRYPYRQITVIPEGSDVDEFLGWASLSTNKMSVSRSFLGHFLKHKKFTPDARILGSKRAMIMSGEYDKVLPMDIMAEYLLKAIISRNIDDMEKLGIYEIAPEDMALCEYVDTSKIEIQKIVRDGLDYLRKELE